MDNLKAMAVRFIISFALFLVSLSVWAKPAKLSQTSEISLLTCSPGDELYSVFGHSALRVFDPEQGIDSVYNYGTFDFETEGFYLKFAQGKLDYMLSRQSFPFFQYTYLLENRSISEAKLLLNWQQKQQLYEFLEENNKVENRFYRYDFFYDNCSTRIRDVLAQVFGDELIYHCKENYGIRFRDQVEKYTKRLDWSLFGISLALGKPYDKTIENEEIMFLPDELEHSFVEATLNGNPLVSTPVEILNREELTQADGLLSPWNLGIAFLFLIAIIVVLEIVRRKRLVWPRRIIMIVIGVVGLLVLLLWIATDHQATKPNFDVIWLMPLNLIFFIGVKKSLSKSFQIYILSCALGCLLAFVLSMTAVFPGYYWSYELALLLFYLSMLIPRKSKIASQI